MCGSNNILTDILDRTGVSSKPNPDGTIGQPDTAKTQIGDTGAAMAVAKRKPRSLLAGAAQGDTSAASSTAPGAKATLGA